MKTTVSFNPHKKPDPVALDIKRITSLIERNNLAAAETEALKLLKAHPQRPDVHNMMGIIYIRQKKLNRAGPHLEFAVKAEPENSFYLNNLGRLYLDLRFIELALPFLRKAQKTLISRRPCWRSAHTTAKPERPNWHCPISSVCTSLHRMTIT